MEQHLEMTAGIRGGKPRILNTRVTVEDIVVLHLRLGKSLEEIAGKYGLPLAALHAAMTYYYDHKGEIDQRIEQDHAYAEAFRRQNLSPLQAKLKDLRLE